MGRERSSSVPCARRVDRRARHARALVALSILGLAVAASLPAAGRGYPWPVRPFAHQHAIRGNFGDPRIKRRDIDVGFDNALSFHSGVDVQAPDGTPVYAIAAGAVLVPRPFVVDVLSPYLAATPPLLFGYWHIDPVVDSFQRVERGQLLGFVRAGLGHVHLSEERFGEFVNPLRPGGLSPYADRTFPVVGRLIAFRSGTAELLDTNALSGVVDLAIEVTDPPPVRPTDGWGDVVLSPERISWSGLFGEWLPAALRSDSVDFDRLPRVALTDVYAPGTRENVAGRPGDYRFWLVRSLDTALLPPGPHGLRVTASDTRGNETAVDLQVRFLEPAPG